MADFDSESLTPLMEFLEKKKRRRCCRPVIGCSCIYNVFKIFLLLLIVAAFVMSALALHRWFYGKTEMLSNAMDYLEAGWKKGTGEISKTYKYLFNVSPPPQISNVRGVTVPPNLLHPDSFVLDLILEKCPKMSLHFSTYTHKMRDGCCLGDLAFLEDCSWKGNFSAVGVMDCPCPTDDERLQRTADKVSRRLAG